MGIPFGYLSNYYNPYNNLETGMYRTALATGPAPAIINMNSAYNYSKNNYSVFIPTFACNEINNLISSSIQLELSLGDMINNSLANFYKQYTNFGNLTVGGGYGLNSSINANVYTTNPYFLNSDNRPTIDFSQPLHRKPLMYPKASSEENEDKVSGSTTNCFNIGRVEQDDPTSPSKNYDDWLANNDFEFNTEKANKLADYIEVNLKGPDDQTYQCAKYVANALNEFDLMDEMKRGHAKDYATKFSNNKNFKELPHNIVATMDLDTLPRGCILIYDAGYKDDGREHEYGHIEVTLGGGKGGSDRIYNIVEDKQSTHIRVFVPVMTTDHYA